MNAVQVAIKSADAFIVSSRQRVNRIGASTAASQLIDFDSTSGEWEGLRQQQLNRERYGEFRNWLYSAINAIARKAAPAEVNVARIVSSRRQRSGDLARFKAMTMPDAIRVKAARQEIHLLMDHPIYDVLSQPNELQNGWDFVYSFFANLCLTGWSYIVGGETKDGLRFYSMPTTWITAHHDNGPFSHFTLRDPNGTERVGGIDLDRKNVAFAHMPNPSDLRSAIAPPTSQRMAIRIDDHIQTSQERFFQNGIFPSMILTVGRDPHPDVPAGIRPRLNGAQRRQINSAINRVYAGVRNYGNPIILDGLIEGVERFSMNQQEMGWERSEDKIRARILSMFGVHPFILGEMAPSSYAQAFVVERQNCELVNSYLGLLSSLMTNFVGSLMDDPNLLIWWQKCEPKNPAEENRLWIAARRAGDVTENEFRAHMGLPPDEDRNEVFVGLDRMQPVIQLLGMVGKQEIERSQALALLEAAGLPTPLAERIVGGDSLTDVTREVRTLAKMLQAGEGRNAVALVS